MIQPEDKMPYFVKAGCVLPTDESEYGFENSEKLVFTVYPINKGNFESEFFTDDGISFSYLNNECVHLYFSVSCDKNKGNLHLIPKIRLCKADSRKLVIC